MNNDRDSGSSAGGGARIAVIGGGIAGMTAAYRLKTLGHSPKVFERNNRVGGRMWSIRKGDFLMDVGMSAYLGTYREAVALIREVGLGGQMSTVSTIGATMRGNTAYRLKFAHPFIGAIGTRAISWKSKLKALRLLADTFRNRESLGYSDYTRLAGIDVETVREYAQRNLNEELLQYLARPLVSGTWVADDADTSIALLLWTVRNMIAPNVYNLNEGVTALPLELARRVEVAYESAVSSVVDKGKSVEISTGSRTEQFDACIIATTAQAALAMYPQMQPIARQLYSTTRYRKLGNICLGLSRRPADPATYYLASPFEDPDTIAIVADHNKAPCRAPASKGLLTVLLSHEFLEKNTHRDDQYFLDHAIGRVRHYYPQVSEADIEQHNVVRWQESVPTISKGRFRLISEYTSSMDRSARVQLASDLDRIPGVNGALVSGHEAALRLDAILKSSKASVRAARKAA